jgi:hypothetical protein
VVDKVALGKVASLVSIIPPRPTYMMLLPEAQTGEAWKPSQKQNCFGNQKHWREK